MAEIQQNSDVTYRVYDWNRNSPDRPLQLDKALDVIDFELNVEDLLVVLLQPSFSCICLPLDDGVHIVRQPKERDVDNSARRIKHPFVIFKDELFGH